MLYTYIYVQNKPFAFLPGQKPILCSDYYAFQNFYFDDIIVIDINKNVHATSEYYATYIDSKEMK